MTERPYRPSPKRPDEEQTGYALRLIREEIRHDTVHEVVALLRSAPQRPWSEDDADSAESRSARAYNYALVVAANTVEALVENDPYDHARCGTSGGCAAPVADFDPVSCPAESSNDRSVTSDAALSTGGSDASRTSAEDGNDPEVSS